MIIETSPSWRVQVIEAKGSKKKLSLGSHRPFARTQISYRRWWDLAAFGGSSSAIRTAASTLSTECITQSCCLLNRKAFSSANLVLRHRATAGPSQNIYNYNALLANRRLICIWRLTSLSVISMWPGYKVLTSRPVNFSMDLINFTVSPPYMSVRPMFPSGKTVSPEKRTFSVLS